MPLVWHGQVLRLTLISAAGWQPGSLASLWQDVVGQEPETDEARPRSNARRQAGALDEVLALEVQAQPSRIDWFMTARLAEKELATDFGAAEHGLRKFQDLFVPWLSTLAFPVGRLALGMIVLSPVVDRRTGYRTLLELVPSVRFNPEEDVSDFLYQINRPKASSTLSGIRINRLMKWSVALVKSLALSVSSDALVQSLPASEASFIRLELDINTAQLDPPDAALPAELLGPTLNELMLTSQRIMTSGELG